MNRKLIWIAVMTTILASQPVFSGQNISIVPKPLTLDAKEGVFALDKKVCVVNADPAHTPVAEYLIGRLTDQAELTLQRKNKIPFFGRAIVLTSKGADAALGDEGYTLTVTKKKITICASTNAGLFYGVQSLLQLIPTHSDSTLLPCVRITDKPRFKWRGLHLDVARHFFDAEFIKKYIDLLAMHKMNVFHWHIVDGQGWRLEIKKYPKLTEIGAWRTGEDGENWAYRNMTFPGKDSGEDLYGGYYTQEQVKEIVAYAAERHITIVPEIEMPGHSWAALVAYPELRCTGNHPDQNVYCAGKEATFKFLEDVLDETLALFPSKFIHIGGDEVNKKFWNQCDDCKHRMKEEGLQNANELQSYFVKRMEKYLNSKGRRLIGWDEILEGGLAPNATVMSWRGMNGGIAAAKSGHDVVMTPVRPLYFDAPQGDRRYEPKTIGYSPNTLKDVYQFEPVPPQLTADEAKHILGAQANAWTEWMFTSDRVEYMVYPRACALSEVVWTAPDLKDWDDFQNRMQQHYLRLDEMGVNYRRPGLKGFSGRTLFMKEHTVTIEKPIAAMEVRYTLDGTEPTKDSSLYEKPFTVHEKTTVKAVGFFPSGTKTHVLTGTFEPAVLHAPVTKTELQPGLKCRYYEGRFDSVKAMDNRKPVKTMSMKEIVFPDGIHRDNFGLIYDGYIKIARDGIYTFYTGSDDGSQLWLHGQLVVDNDGLHGYEEKSAQMGLKAGLHPIQVRFFEAGGGERLTVHYEGPGIGKTTVPANLLFMEAAAAKSKEPAVSTVQKETKEAFDQRMEWWRDARFGMFIHWGLYAIPAGEWNGKTNHAEWIRTTAQIPDEEYIKFAPQFNPVHFDAAAWVRMAKEAGMKYIVITSKHHDGFCLFDSKVTDYDVMDATPFKRDILKELTDECKKQGIRMCFYHSIMDWHHPDYLPRRGWEKRSAEGADFQRYITYMKAQLKELIEGYNPGVLWFDGEWEKTWTHEEGLDLYNYVRSLNPNIIINNRVDKGRRGMEGMSKGEHFAGDFGTPEQQIPATGIPGYDWESCITMNKHWGWNKHDKNFKSTQDLIRNLVDIASKGGNFLLNIGPKPDGTFPQESIDRLKGIGEWMDVNGESIYGTTASRFANLPWGRSTTKGNTLYLHVFDWPKDGKLNVPGLVTPVKEASLLADPANKLTVETSDDGIVIQLPAEPVDKIATVVKLTFSDTPKVTSK